MRQEPFASSEEPMEHFGTKGMKWGVRNERSPKTPLIGYVKEPIVRTTKNGDSFTLTPRPPKIVKALGRIDRIKSGYNKTGSSLQITDKNGEVIGKASFVVKNKEDIHLSLISIEKSARGKGYATEILKGCGGTWKSFGSQTHGS